MTHYTTLGVANMASADTIKRAYRKLAMKHHPDRHRPGSAQKNAEAQFKLVQQAYDVLGDAPKRARYDSDLAWSAKSAYSFYEPPKNRPVSTEHLNVYTHVDMPAKDWYEGCGVEVSLPSPQSVLCPRCYGAPRGWCTECNNRGRVMRRTMNVYVPARTNYGKLMTVEYGGMNDEFGNCGKLFLHLRVQGMDKFILRGHDLHTTVEVPPAILRFGGQWDVRVLEGQYLRVTIPARMKIRGKLRLAGYGVLHNDRERGDMYVEVEAWQPFTFGQAVGSWLQHLRFGLRNAWAPVGAWWNREVTV